MPYLGIGCVEGGGGLPINWYTLVPAYAVFHPVQVKTEVSNAFYFDIVATHNDHPSSCKTSTRQCLCVLYPILGVGCSREGARPEVKYLFLAWVPPPPSEPPPKPQHVQWNKLTEGQITSKRGC